MKTLKLLLATLALPLMLSAQDVDIAKDGTVTVDGKATFKIDGKQGMAGASFSVYNLNGDLLISADGRSENKFMTVTFSGNNSSLDYPLTLGTKKVFAKDIAKMQVIKDGALNPDGLKRFVAKYNGRADQKLVLTEQNTRNTINIGMRPTQVNRNREANIFIFGTSIKQDNKEIGKITSKQEISQGIIIDYFTVADVEGNHVANISKAMNSQQIDIVTYDNNRFAVQAPNAHINNIALQELITKELVKRGLL
ncbi:MAG: hypothetical protein QM642_02440 [Edaphocola sp.]